MINVLYSDGSIIVCEKPAGVLSQNDAKGEKGLTELLIPYSKTGQVYPVHRLDRPVGGVMVYACDKASCAKLSSAGAIEKTYLTLVSGRPESEKGELFDYMYKDGAKNKSFVASKSRKGVKEARLLYEVLEYYAERDVSLVKVRLITGRTHQIRVQFSSRGMPVVGDGKYGSRIKDEFIALWSHRISFAHPKTGDLVEYNSFPYFLERK